MNRLFSRILVPFDFSPQSEQALETAFALAPLSGGEITVLNAIPPVTSLAGIRPPGGPVWLPPDDLLAATRDRMESIAARAAGGRRSLRVRCRVVVGEPFPEIMAAAARADLVVLATTGRGAISHVFVGSIAEKVVRHSPAPVLTIGRQAATRLRRARRSAKRRPAPRAGD